MSAVLAYCCPGPCQPAARPSSADGGVPEANAGLHRGPIQPPLAVIPGRQLRETECRGDPPHPTRKGAVHLRPRVSVVHFIT